MTRRYGSFGKRYARAGLPEPHTGNWSPGVPASAGFYPEEGVTFAQARSVRRYSHTDACPDCGGPSEDVEESSGVRFGQGTDCVKDCFWQMGGPIWTPKFRRCVRRCTRQTISSTPPSGSQGTPAASTGMKLSRQGAPKTRLKHRTMRRRR